ncbi:uncharacterized protein LOC131016047 isoform X1 [Salvia miltiorrhiza]|uniref:uncharacterized protein LOC131001306 n=1 Tax=Salvia miltiorrhiza TaxID=226208 RepID=UPI0025AC85FF|nr:uncharacterized protein LOC131001306 [Salvia miltiorrhiza]XP_057800572.1 uncharacterized protein LOC131016047 isoform X1 [Salvia miltiorrhiza]
MIVSPVGERRLSMIVINWSLGRRWGRGGGGSNDYRLGFVVVLKFQSSIILLEILILEVERRLAELRQTQEEVTPVDVERIFREVVAPDSRGRIMGLGMMMSRAITESGESSSTHSTSTSQFPFPVASRDELITLREELSSTQRELEVRRASEEAQSKAIQEMQAQIALLMRGYHAQSPSDASDGTHPDL